MGFTLDQRWSFCNIFMNFTVYEILITQRKHQIRYTNFILSQNRENLKIQLTLEMEN